MSVRTVTIRTPQARAAAAGPPPDPEAYWEIVPIYGQSLAGGFGGMPAITTTAVAEGHAWMLQTGRGDGPRVNDFDGNALVAPASLSAVIPLHEVDEPGVLQQHGETFASGFAAALAARMPDVQALVFACGQDSQSITALSPGTNHYTNLLTAITRAVALNPTDLPPRVAAVLYSQGEADTSNASYQSQIAALAAQLAIDVRAITGQITDPVLLLNMEATHVCGAAAAAPKPLIAKRALHLTDPRCRVSGVHYWLPHNADELHLPAASSRAYGQQLAWAWHRHAIAGLSVDIVQPDSIALVDGFCEVTFSGADTLALDSAGVSDPGNFGFVYVRAGALVPITAVTLAGPLTVRLATSDVWDGGVLRYAMHNATMGDTAAGAQPSARGCLRGEAAIYPDVITADPRYNWAIPFEIAVPEVPE